MKNLKLQVSIVSNGAGNKKILNIADCLDEGDWVRLSLDSGTDPYISGHAPAEIQNHAGGNLLAYSQISRRSTPGFKVGFSYIVTWQGAQHLR